MPQKTWFPEPGSYVKYFDATEKATKFLRLLWRRAPIVYPFRMPALSAGEKGNNFNFEDLDPAEKKKHRLLAYIGVSPGFLWYLYHPVDKKILKLDEKIEDIDEDITQCLTHALTPYDTPTVCIALENGMYPALCALNISGETRTPAGVWVCGQYVVQEHEELSQEELIALGQGRLRSYPWDFGGEL